MSRYIEYEPLMAELEREVELADDWKTAHEIANVVKYAPTIEAPSWIPCSERLPTEEEQDIDLGVLVTLGNGYKGMDFDWYHNGHWYDWGDRVIAWMPLPKPYEEADDERHDI